MAIDTSEKRQSSYGMLMWSVTPGIDPSSIDVAERQAAAHVYSGILSTILSSVAVIMASYRRRREH